MVRTNEETESASDTMLQEDSGMADELNEILFRNGLKIYEQLRPKLLTEHEGASIFIDCVSGQYVIQGKNETRFEAEARLLKKCPDAEIFMDHIDSDDFAHSLPAMTSR